MDYLSDDQIDGMFDDDGPYQEQAELAPAAPAQLQPVPLYPLALAQTPIQQASNGAAQMGVVGLATKKMGPLPLWAWLLLGGTTAGAGYFYYRGRKGSDGNDGGEDKPGIVQTLMGAATFTDSPVTGGWAPSRSSFSERLTGYFSKKGFSEHVVVWHDAEDAKAKGKLAHVSPLINVQVKSGGVKCDTALQRFCRRDGLNPVQHQDGSIGLYPHTGKRGKEWEGYVDALRDEGQNV